MGDENEETQETTPISEPEVTPENIVPENIVPEPEPEPEPEVIPESTVQEPTGMLDIFPEEDTSLSNLNIIPDVNVF